MSSEEQAKRFINTLKELGGSAGNGSLSAELGWADSTYQRIKARLIEEGRIVPGRGRGGSVALAEGKAPARAGKAEPRTPAPRAKATVGSGSGQYAQSFNAIDKAMRNDEGLASELDYAEQTSLDSLRRSLLQAAFSGQLT